MKNTRMLTPNDTIDNRIGLSRNHAPVPAMKRSYGSLTDKYPVILDGGKTTIYIKDKNKESEIRDKYEMRKIKRIMGSALLPR